MQPPSLPRCYDIMIHRLFPYDDIAAHLGARIAHHRPGACGTGNLTLALARLDYHVAYPCLSVGCSLSALSVS